MRLILVPAVAALALALPASAAPTGLGQTSGTALPCPAQLTAVQHTSVGGASYETPTAGVVTSFSYQAGVGAAGQVRALFFTRTATNTFLLVGKSPLSLAPAGALTTFPTRFSVPAGALLGGQVGNVGMRCAVQAGSSGDEYKFGAFDPDVSSTMTTTGSVTGRWAISAVLEPDADRDGYGDDSQDLCPTSAALQTACPAPMPAPAPDVLVTKAPKKKSGKRKAKVVFASSVPGSTFTCKVDAGPAAACTSPFRTKVAYGKHTVVITATSPAGVVDPTPAVVRFRVRKPA